MRNSITSLYISMDLQHRLHDLVSDFKNLCCTAAVTWLQMNMPLHCMLPAARGSTVCTQQPPCPNYLPIESKGKKVYVL